VSVSATDETQAEVYDLYESKNTSIVFQLTGVSLKWLSQN